LVFVDVGDDSIIIDNIITPSNPSVAPIKEEELEETPLDMNVF
jgi:hypothetical protein